MRYVYDFDQQAEGGRELLGGKGVGLAEMTQFGVPVPAGFTITTEACRAYWAKGGRFPDGLEEEIAEHLATLEERTGKRFGDPHDPLLVSVRSGAAVSMPGMMDTILNLGLNDEAAAGVASVTGNKRFAYDSYRRLIQMYGEVVDGIDPYRFEQALGDLKKQRGARQDVDLDGDDLAGLVETFRELYRSETGEGFPADAREQLSRAVRAVFESWDTPRAQVYRAAQGIPHDLGTAVNVVQMVFGNSGENSGTGVLFTRDPATGERGLYGEFLVNAQGEDVVAGIRTPEPLEAMKKRMPAAFDELMETIQNLEEHYSDMQDIEFTVEDGTLYLLQTRAAKRTAAAALKAAVDMVDEGLISREEAVARIDPRQLDQLLHPMLDPNAQYEVAAKGLNASPGAASGEVVFDADTAAERGKAGEKVILVRWETTPDDIHGLIEAAGILTAHGGMTSHAAVVARGMGKPCVAGCEDLTIDARAKTAQIGGHEVVRGRRDHDRRRNRTGDHRPRRSRPAADQRGLRHRARVGGRAAPPEGAGERRHAGRRGQGSRVRRAGDRPLPDRAHVHGRGPAPARPRDDHGHGRGLQTRRARQAPAAPAVRLRGDLRGDGGPAGHDPPARPAAPRVPPLAGRSRRRGGAEAHPRASGVEPDAGDARLPARARCTRRSTRCRYVRSSARPSRWRSEAATRRSSRSCIRSSASRRSSHGCASSPSSVAEEEGAGEYLCGTMIELPRACVRADEIAQHADFFSFGTNDLTQTALGFSRDDAEGKFLTFYLEDGILERNPFETLDLEGVGDLMRIAVERGREVKEDIKLGICGEHGGDPQSIAFCHELGLDYVSCSPYRVPLARLAAAQAALKESGVEAVAVGG